MKDTKSAGMIYDFLKTVPPFHLLPDAEIRDLSRTLTLEHFHPEQVILSPASPPNQFLYLIRSGEVRLIPFGGRKESAGPVVDMRGEGEFFGFFSLLGNRPSPFTIVAERDTVCFLLGKASFLRLLDTYPDVLLYFTMGPSKGFKTSVPGRPAEGSTAAPSGPEPDILFFSARVRDIMHPHVAVCPDNESVVAAARLMTTRGVGSLVVVDPAQNPIGILTDGDLRRKVIASGELKDVPVKGVMSHPLSAVPPDAFLFDAILLMIRKRIKYLPVLQGPDLAGILSERDLMISQGNNPVAIIRRIQQAPDLEELVLIRKEITHTLKVMLERGGQAREICQLITQLNDHLTVRIIELAAGDLDREGKEAPPLPFVWVSLGSEGRQEQTLSTDQDNALIFGDSDPDSEADAKAYFLVLAERVVSGLERCGFPRCKGDMMASNPQWCQPLRVWKDYYQKWIFQRDLSAQDILISSIFFDFRAIYGPESLLNDLIASIKAAIPESKVFLPHMALRSLELRTPLSFFNRLVVERSGQYKNRLNIKRHGLMPLIDAVRILSLEQGIFRTNTLDRIAALMERDIFAPGDGNNLREAFNLMMLLRLHHNLEQLNQGEELDNYIEPSELSTIQRSNLKMAFKAIDRLQSQIEIRYGLTTLRKR
ncbi:putative CBS domain and cyclic nucleotide-regulated nucleotidyltransferase [uncultured Desulfatiglans sp.]|uniref:Putative CBS domain and cyclic nucleotide-regulated nucleotidyltransferase n=1 Tax=Uncultured Desulfatiglans sp. TaxID=1748965 RepID=A0A653A574_UNCDX|nr:putative CBS domain and cyclic nucleotide-regulated nucleotidyltransferase [uncultured Desulfatiglans sp.]